MQGAQYNERVRTSGDKYPLFLDTLGTKKSTRGQLNEWKSLPRWHKPLYQCRQADEAKCQCFAYLQYSKF